MTAAIPDELRLRLLFVPVSGPRGMGEYARSLAIASAVALRWPQAHIHFVLSAAAPYSASTPFPKTILPSSPTFHTKEVIQVIRDFQPTIVVFDNAGRTAQLQTASRSGARVVFVSSRQRQRRRAFRVRWMNLIDEHWIAWPRFIAGEPGPIESLKLRVLRRPALRFLDTILPAPDADVDAAMLAKFAVRHNEYVLVVPGGGSDHKGAENAPEIVAVAASRIAEQGHATILVGVTPEIDSGANKMLRVAPRMPMNELAALIRNARLVISNGGDTLLQALSCQRPCVAVPIAGDQAFRIARCVAVGLAVGADLNSDDLANKGLSMLDDGSARTTVSRAITAAAITNGLETALDAIAKLATAPFKSLPPKHTTA